MLFGGVFFLLLSFIFNIIEILIFKSAHINDIIHVFPTIFIYEPIINAIGSYNFIEIYYTPLACLIDFVVGLIISFILTKFEYTRNHFLVSLVLIFLFYWIFVTYQWIPIL